MTDDTSAPVPRRSPSKLPLGEQAALSVRLQRGRQRRPPISWQELAVEQGFAQRTLEHFYMRASKLEENADKRPDLVIAEERARRFILAQLAATPASRTLFALSDVPDDLVFPPLRRKIKLSQLPLREQAALFDELYTARQVTPRESWRYLAIQHGFAERTLEHFYWSAMKLERNAGKRPATQIFVELVQAQSTAMPVGRRSGRDPDRRRARKARSAAETDRSEALRRDERRAAEAREIEQQQRGAQELLADAEEEDRREAEEEQLNEGDPHRQFMDVWDSSWGPQPGQGLFDV